MPSRQSKVEWRYLQIVHRDPKKTTSREPRRLSQIASLRWTAKQNPYYVRLADLCAKFVCDLFGCVAYSCMFFFTSSLTHLTYLSASSTSRPAAVSTLSEATVTLRDFVTYLFHVTQLGLPRGINEILIWSALFVLECIKRTYPRMKCTYGHRLFLASFIMCQKYSQDVPIKNKVLTYDLTSSVVKPDLPSVISLSSPRLKTYTPFKN